MMTMNATFRMAPFLAVCAVILSCAGQVTPRAIPPSRTAEDLKKIWGEAVGGPHVEEITPRIFSAIGYDLANVILIRTTAGNIIVDTAMTRERARTIRDALLARAPGPIAAIIYTHSHIDHVGGTDVFAGPDTPIWATSAFGEHFLKQYALFAPAEQRRGRLQFGENLPPDLFPCPAIGQCLDFPGLSSTGMRMPTRTFSGTTHLTVGDTDIVLMEALGETHDTLMVWIPGDKALLCADNFYRTFPNLYTIRGTSPRPVDQWIASLDTMRALQPEHLVPQHTRPISGRDAIQAALTDYRDAIQWVRDATIRGANAGLSVDAIVEKTVLPPRLADTPYLRELYGQVDWSIRGIYDSNLGWFDGRPETLYPLPAPEAARREITLMGGPESVMAEAAKARAAGDTRWAVHLLAKVKASGLVTGAAGDNVTRDLSSALEQQGIEAMNLNGKAFLLGSAAALVHPPSARKPPDMDDALLARVPLRNIFQIMAVRLDPAAAMDVVESATWIIPDERAAFTVTIRRGIAEIREGDPLPGTPPPVAVLTTDGLTWRRIAVKKDSPARALATGKLKIRGSWIGLLRFISRFDRGA